MIFFHKNSSVEIMQKKVDNFRRRTVMCNVCVLIVARARSWTLSPQEFKHTESQSVFFILGGRVWFGFGLLSSEHGTPLIINHEANSPGSSDNEMNFRLGSLKVIHGSLRKLVLLVIISSP